MDGYGKRVLVVEDDETRRNMLSVLLVLAGYNVYPAILSLDDLPADIRGTKSPGDDTLENLSRTLSALQRERVLAVLESTHGNKERAARLLGISRRTLYVFLTVTPRTNLPLAVNPQT